MTTEKRPEQFVFQLEIRPEKRKSPEFRLLVDALLSAAREELEWERQKTAGQSPQKPDRRSAS